MPDPTANKGYNNPTEGFYARAQLGSALQDNWDAIDTDLSTPEDVNLQPEGAQSGVVVDAAGLVYTAVLSRTLPVELGDSNHDVTFIAHYTESGAADEVVEARLIDESDGSTIAALSFDATEQLSTALTDTELPDADQAVHVEWEVTTASATGGAAGDLDAALLEVR